MRIGVNCFPLMSHVGGLKHYFWNVFDYLLEHDLENEYVFFHFPQNTTELAQLRSTHWQKIAIYLERQEQISDHFNEIDVYFCPFSILWPRPTPVPSVVMLADVQEVYLPQFFSAADRLDRALHFPGSTRAADRVITISEFSKTTICRAHGISPGKVIVAHLCADDRYFRADQIARPPRALPPFDAYLLYPANRWLHKNHNGLLRAMRILRTRGLEVNGVFTGYDVTRGGYPLLEKARELGLEKHVHVAGYISVEEMAYFYRHARMLVFPSLFEGFGIPVVEAMAAGCPMAVSAATSLPEISGDAAVYFDATSDLSIADAIEQLWVDASARARLIERGRKRAETFPSQRMGEAHVRAFREAREAFSPLRYRWQRHAYQRYHWYYVHLRHWGAARLPNGASDRICGILFGSGWHHREDNGVHSFRWTKRRSRLKITVPREMKLTMTTDLASAIIPNSIDVVLNGKSVANWLIEGEGPMFRPVPSLVLELRAGRNLLEFVSGQPAVSGTSDPRKLALAFQDVRLDDPAGEVSCVFKN